MFEIVLAPTSRGENAPTPVPIWVSLALAPLNTLHNTLLSQFIAREPDRAGRSWVALIIAHPLIRFRPYEHPHTMNTIKRSDRTFPQFRSHPPYPKLISVWPRRIARCFVAGARGYAAGCHHACSLFTLAQHTAKGTIHRELVDSVGSWLTFIIAHAL